MTDYGDVLNRYRVFPRFFSLIFMGLLCYTSVWFMELQMPSPEQAAFSSAMLAASAAWFKFYVSSGNTNGTKD